MEKSTIAIRSRPSPNAHPILLGTPARYISGNWRTRRLNARTRGIECRLDHHSAPQDFEPLSLEEDLDLEAGAREREIRLDPAHA